MSGDEKRNPSSNETNSSKVLLATVTFNRRELVEFAIRSWLENFDANLFTLVVVDNASEDSTFHFLKELASKGLLLAIRLKQNFGTAPALNLAWLLREEGQHAIKADSDIVVHTKGTLRRMIEVADACPSIGIVGLKRPDLIERPDHPDLFYRSKIIGLRRGDVLYVLEFCHHIMGSFTLYNKAVLKDFGFLYQFQDEREGPAYGFDDALACFRMKALKKSTCFLRAWVDKTGKKEVRISHIDPGEAGGDAFLSKYTRWKREVAAKAMARYQGLARAFLAGKISPRYEARWDFGVLKGQIEEVAGDSRALTEKIRELV